MLDKLVISHDILKLREIEQYAVFKAYFHRFCVKKPRKAGIWRDKKHQNVREIMLFRHMVFDSNQFKKRLE